MDFKFVDKLLFTPENIYFEDFSKKEDIIAQFDISPSELDGCEILFAAYGAQSYEGDARVIFKKDDKIYVVAGSHCSCYGLEDQWDPIEMLQEDSLSEYMYDTQTIKAYETLMKHLFPNKNTELQSHLQL